ncbi:MAG: phosphate/phosphite/phosphonate ABC transporter substrate-binding protein [Nitrospirae bacterium]|nr:MAG: phosphate/phosphite/phosphonate ABC transporter substrate-binding protein [Nitrospirota bacterium]
MGKLERRVLGALVFVIILGAIVALVVVHNLQKKSIYDTAQEKMIEMSKVISKAIERTMLEGRSDVTMAMSEDLKTLKGVESIEVLNYEGREAFNRQAPRKEANALKRFQEDLSPFTEISGEKMLIYRPLENTPACQKCHKVKSPFLGAVKISMSLEHEREKVARMTTFNLIATLFVIVILSFILWLVLKRVILSPIEKIKNAAGLLSEGDLNFRTGIEGDDEIGLTSNALRDALQSISDILNRVKEVAKRVSKVSADVEKDSREMVEATKVETESIENISSSIEELNASISEISENTNDLAVSSEEIASAIEEMAASVSQIAENSSELFESVESTSTSIEEMSSSLKEVANHAADLLKSADDTLSTVEEITASVKEVEANTKESAKLSEQVMQEASTEGKQSIEKTIEGMEKIKISVETTAEYIKRLGGRSEEIGKILTVIDEITDQTTLLALNAAILAAQAGEHGKGFSVVADEIKDLAERTSFSTQEISTLIQTVQKEVSDAVYAMNLGLEAVNEGLKLSKDASRVLEKVIESSRRSSEMATAIEHSTSEQAEATRFVAESMEKVRDMVGQIAKATSEQSKGMGLLMSATERVRDIATQLKTATEEQSQQNKIIRDRVEMVSDKSQQIASAINEQKIGTEQISQSIRNISDIPVKNRNLSFKVNNALRSLQKDTDLIVTEMEKFRLVGPSKLEKGLRFGVVPLQSPAEMFRKFIPLVEYLGRKTGKKIELKVGVDFQGAVKDIGEGITQLCFLTPSTYVIAHKNYGVRVLVKGLNRGKPYHHSVIITRADSNINSLEDLKGKSFCFGDPESTSSHIVPRYMLLNAGIDLSDLLFYNYLGHHDDVAEAVLSGEYDAGAVMELTAEKYKDRGLKFIKFSEEIPEFNVCATKEMPEDEAEEIKKALIELTDKTTEGLSILRAINEHYTGFVEAEDEDYEKIRDIMTQLKMI